jgi:phage gp46-like protein
MFVDLALEYDPVLRVCDAVFDGVDFVLDDTPATAMLIAIGADRRARPDDTLPDTVTNDYRPSRLNAKRGWCGDALDAQGNLIGSRLWLIGRAKQTEATRRLAESAVGECLSPIEASRGISFTVEVRWVARGVLGILARAGNATLNFSVPVSG